MTNQQNIIQTTIHTLEHDVRVEVQQYFTDYATVNDENSADMVDELVDQCMPIMTTEIMRIVAEADYSLALWEIETYVDKISPLEVCKLAIYETLRTYAFEELAIIRLRFEEEEDILED